MFEEQSHKFIMPAQTKPELFYRDEAKNEGEFPGELCML